jgi:hypothetical protein
MLLVKKTANPRTPFRNTTQDVGHFVISFLCAFCFVSNAGYNCPEVFYFCMKEWLPFADKGKRN